MNITEQIIRECIQKSDSRLELWPHFLDSIKAKYVLELGVYRGYFAERILKECGLIEKYYMIDPWRHLNDYVKPENKNDEMFEQFLSEAKTKTDFAAEKRIILRGKTTEVIEQIPDGELDFAYIDGDHTLKGISIDLIRVFPKIKAGGWIGGDDFVRTVWQHTTKFEPTLVFPFAVYFAEAVNATIYALPHDQFLMEKNDSAPFAFIDLTGFYENTSLRFQFRPGMGIKTKFLETFPKIFNILNRTKLIKLK
jgi:predicted O-methyltransferase YrrM